jgi:hypothetical protein
MESLYDTSSVQVTRNLRFAVDLFSSVLSETGGLAQSPQECSDGLGMLSDSNSL